MFRLLRFSAALWIIPATCGADLKVLDAPADLVFHARGGPYRLHLRAEGGGLTDVQGQVSAVRLLNGKENIPSALELQGPLASIGAGQIAYYSFQPRAELLPSPGTYRAMLLLHYRDGNLAKALTVTLDLQLPPATVTPVQDPPLRLLLRRSIPFTQASGTARALLQSNDREVRLVLPSEGTLTVIQGKSKVLHPDAWVRAVEGGGGNRNHMAITLEAAIPAGFTRGEGKLRVVTAPAQADQFIAVEAYVRDGPLAPISVLVCFHLLAYLINRYIRVTRPAQALRAQVLHVEGELNELLSVQPELTDRQETRELRSAIRKAQARLDEPDLAAAQAALAEALALLETLRRMNMQEGAPFAQPLDPEITVGGPMGEISPAAPARLLLQGGAADAVRWVIRGEGLHEEIPEGSGPTEHTFRRPGLYRVSAVVAGKEVAAGGVYVARPLASKAWRAIRTKDVLIELAALTLTVLASVSLYADADSFGTFGDYLMLVMAAFGISASTRGFTALLGALAK